MKKSSKKKSRNEKKEETKTTQKPKPEGYIFGRPTHYTKELGERICELVATHPVGYDTIKMMHPDLPPKSVVTQWRLKHPDFAANYLSAKAFQAEIMVEDIDDIIPHEVKTYFDDKGNERIDSPSASLAIAKANNRKWTAARLAPKRYGDLTRLENLETENVDLKRELQELREQLDAKNKKDY